MNFCNSFLLAGQNFKAECILFKATEFTTAIKGKYKKGARKNGVRLRPWAKSFMDDAGVEMVILNDLAGFNPVVVKEIGEKSTFSEIVQSFTRNLCCT